MFSGPLCCKKTSQIIRFPGLQIQARLIVLQYSNFSYLVIINSPTCYRTTQGKIFETTWQAQFAEVQRHGEKSQEVQRARREAAVDRAELADLAANPPRHS
jgi:hypothetical protein